MMRVVEFMTSARRSMWISAPVSAFSDPDESGSRRACFLPRSLAMRTVIGKLPRALCAAVALCLAPHALAAQAGACATPDSSSAAPDSTRFGVPVLIIARVHADAVVFESEPDVRVTVNGCDPPPGQLRTTSTLPDTIVPGVRYTNVEVTTEYRAWLTIECRAPEETVARLCEELSGRQR
jgi:hypothetical protein